MQTLNTWQVETSFRAAQKYSKVNVNNSKFQKVHVQCSKEAGKIAMISSMTCLRSFRIGVINTSVNFNFDHQFLHFRVFTVSFHI